MAYPAVAEPLRDVAANNLQGTRDGHELANLAVDRYTEIGINQFAFQIDSLIRLIMPLQVFYLRTVEPVVEALPVEGIRLRIDAVVVEGRRQGRLDALDFERQPAARARRVRQELHVVARAAERGQVRQVLMVAAVGPALVDGGHGHRTLHLVQLLGQHRVQLLPAHQPVLCQHDAVVLRQHGRVGLRIKVVAQLRGQQVGKPRRLIRALHYAVKNEALLRLQELLSASEYLGAVPDPKGRDYIVDSHLFKTTIGDSDSWIVVNETIWNEFLVHSVSDNIPSINRKQDF